MKIRIVIAIALSMVQPASALEKTDPAGETVGAPHAAPEASPAERQGQGGVRARAPAPPASSPASAAPPAAGPPPPAPVVTGSGFRATLYGFVELDLMRDSTQGYGEGIGAALLPREPATTGSRDRLQATARSSRVGLRLQAPPFEGISTTGIVEVDFFGNQPNPLSEAAFVGNGTVRLRHANARLQTPIVDLLVGQSFHLFGWQPRFYPATVSYPPLPNQAFGRAPQIRLSRRFQTESLAIEIAAGVFRPPQRNSGTPDFQSGVLFQLDAWRGIHTGIAGPTSRDALSLGISTSVRGFEVSANRGEPSTSKLGYGISVDTLLPVVPSRHPGDVGNTLSVNASYFSGTGIADLVAVSNGVPYPVPLTGVLPEPDIDPGLVTYDERGRLHTIQWQGLLVGAEYHVPPSGRLWLAANVSRGVANQLTAANGWAGQRGFYRKAEYVDASLFYDITPAFRSGLACQRARQIFADGARAHNTRLELSFFLFF